MNNEIPVPLGKFKSVGIKNLADILEHEITVEEGYGVTTHALKFKGGGTATVHIGDDNLFNVTTEGLDGHVTTDGQFSEILLSVSTKSNVT